MTDADLPLHAFAFSSNGDCKPCHREIFDECAEDQHALAWFNEPFLRQDPKRTECNNCHAPQPILVVGIEAIPKIRNERFEEGVGCIECHANVDHVEGPRASGDAPCNPRYNPLFSESVICSSCHAPHGTIDEWEESEWSKKGYTCQGCHMPLIDAPVVTGGPVRRRRSHRMLSQRDPKFLSSAVQMKVSVEGGSKVRVSVANTGVGHNLPGEIFNREIFLETIVFDQGGVEKGRHRESFKTVRREQRATETSTQLRSGETRVFEYELSVGSGTVRVRLGYKEFLYQPDDSARSIHEKTLSF
jgi:RNase P subunit RPR2